MGKASRTTSAENIEPEYSQADAPTVAATPPDSVRPRSAQTPSVDAVILTVAALSTTERSATDSMAERFDPSSSREALIASAAYYRAERRGFAAGHELEDWIAAEQEIDSMGTNI